jgi:hypothetical protein
MWVTFDCHAIETGDRALRARNESSGSTKNDEMNSCSTLSFSVRILPWSLLPLKLLLTEL